MNFDIALYTLKPVLQSLRTDCTSISLNVRKEEYKERNTVLQIQCDFIYAEINIFLAFVYENAVLGIFWLMDF